MDATTLLLRRARDGEAGAADALCQRHAARLRLFVRARLGTALSRRLDVDDVVQETWLRALPDLGTVQPDGEQAFFRWLCTAANHVLADAARAARAQKRGPQPVRLDRSAWSSIGALAGGGPGPLTALLLSEQDRHLEAALAGLPLRYRRVIRLRQFEGLPARDAAARLGCTEGAAHALFRRALAAWAEAVGEA